MIQNSFIWLKPSGFLRAYHKLFRYFIWLELLTILELKIYPIA